MTDQSARTPNRIQIALWAALLIVATSLSLSDYQSFQLGAYNDDASYVILAHSLVHSDHYGLINQPGPHPGPTQYPFGYPLLLAPFVLAFPGWPGAMRVLSLVATLVSAGFLFWGWPYLGRRSYWWALAVAGLYLLGPLTIEHTRMVMSEPVFLALSLGAILTAEKIAREVSNWRLSLSLGILLSAILFVRTIGFITLVGLVLYLLLRRGRRALKGLALTASAMVVAVLAVLVFTPVDPLDLLPGRYLQSSVLVIAKEALMPNNTGDPLPSGYMTGDGGGSANGLSQRNVTSLLLDYAVGDLELVRTEPRHIVVPLGGGSAEEEFGNRLGIPWLPEATGYLSFALIVVGYIGWFKQEGISAFNLSSIVYFCLLLAWDWQGPRLLYPVQPQLQCAFLMGCEMGVLLAARAWRRSDTSRRVGRLVLPVFVLVLLAVAVRASIRPNDSRSHMGDLETRTRWLAANTPASAIVMTEEPERDYIYGGRRTVRQPRSMASSVALSGFLVDQRVDYVLIAPSVEWGEVYSPHLSEATKELLRFTAQLVAEKKISPVYVSEPNLLCVFRVRHQDVGSTLSQASQ